MRIVADTNTVLSGLLWQGTPRRLLDLARERKVTLCTSLVLLAELAEVMTRDKFAERLRTAGVSAIDLVQDYARLTETVTPDALPEPVIERDPDDDHVLACAVSAKAQLIVSGDSHLLDLKAYQGIPIHAASVALGEIVAAPR
jgi:putative PIN family toxin of toxin-antitoxin system